MSESWEFMSSKGYDRKPTSDPLSLPETIAEKDATITALKAEVERLKNELKRADQEIREMRMG